MTTYSTPTAGQEAQDLARRISHDLWDNHSDEFGYRTEKQAINRQMGQHFHPENIWSFWGQFDRQHQARFIMAAHAALARDEPGAEDLCRWIDEATA